MDSGMHHAWAAVLPFFVVTCASPSPRSTRVVDKTNAASASKSNYGPKHWGDGGLQQKDAHSSPVIDFFSLPLLPQYPCKPEWRDSWDGGLPLPSTEGDAGAYDQLIDSLRPEIKGCYKEGLARNPELGGAVIVRTVVAANGGIKEIGAICTTLADPVVVRCIVAVFRKAHFPKVKGDDVTIHSPIWLLTEE